MKAHNTLTSPIEIHLNRDLPVILIDTSYFIFYRYFSTVKWYKYKQKNIDFSRIHEDDVFVIAFLKHALSDFTKICKQWKTTLSQLVFCCDCYRECIWRNDFIDGYKQQRIQSAEFNPYIFALFYKHLEDKQKEWDTKVLYIDKLEADDIAYLTKKTLQEKGWTEQIIIITNDNDYLQVIDEQTRIFNMNGKGNDIAKRSCGDPKKDLRIKMIMGDKSDNIQPIHSGIGPVTATKLAALSDDELEVYLAKKNCKDIYENNRKLIDFEMIPSSHVKTFEKTYEWKF
jgi:5'-3' exonuclease